METTLQFFRRCKKKSNKNEDRIHNELNSGVLYNMIYYHLVQRDSSCFVLVLVLFVKREKNQFVLDRFRELKVVYYPSVNRKKKKKTMKKMTLRCDSVEIRMIDLFSWLLNVCTDVSGFKVSSTFVCEFVLLQQQN